MNQDILSNEIVKITIGNEEKDWFANTFRSPIESGRGQNLVLYCSYVIVVKLF